MCHSVEMYLPQMTRCATEQRVGEADFAAAERERRLVDAGLALLGRVGRLAGFLTPLGALLKLEKVSNLLKNNRMRFEHDSWLTEGEAHGLGHPAAAASGMHAECAVGRAAQGVRTR